VALKNINTGIKNTILAALLKNVRGAQTYLGPAPHKTVSDIVIIPMLMSIHFKSIDRK